MRQPRLPLWKVVFVDWHGVLSHRPFWFSILNGRADGLSRALQARLSHIFDVRPELGDGWMRGQAQTSELFAPVVGALGAARKKDFLQRRIIRDCLAMPLEPALASTLARAVDSVQVVVATDNTADFELAFRSAQRRARIAPAHGRPQTMRELAALLDDIICSSTTGVFKAESPEAFFGPWLDASCLRFEDALLIDDRSENCDAFEACGGSAVHWRAELHDRHLALAEVRAWIDDEPITSTVSTAACTAASCRAPAASAPARPSLPARRLVPAHMNSR